MSDEQNDQPGDAPHVSGMAHVRLTRDRDVGGDAYLAGTELALPADEAQALVDSGDAVPVD